MATKRATASTAESRSKVQLEKRNTQGKRQEVQQAKPPNVTTQPQTRRGSDENRTQKMTPNMQKLENQKGKPPISDDTKSKPGRRGSSSSVFEDQIPKPSAKFSQFTANRRGSNQSDSGIKVNDVLQKRRASDPGAERRDTQQNKSRVSEDEQRRRASDFGAYFPTHAQGQNRRSSGSDLIETEPKYTEVHCTWCQRKGKRTKGHFYCHDCDIGLCEICAKEHVKDITMNRHSVSVISDTYMLSPNQGPFPNMTQIGSIKLDQEVSIRGSAFLPTGVLLVGDYSNSKVRMFTGDYTRKHVASLTLQKENKWDENRPKPLDIADVSSEMFAFTTNTGCIYIANVGVSMLMKVDRIITVIRFESNYGECLGLAFNDADDCLYVGCTSDRDGTYFNIYGLDGVQHRTIRNSITDVPEYLAFGPNKTKLYAADSDSVTVYDVRDFSMTEEYTELQAQTKDILVDKYGYLYTLALERRTFKSPGSLYRLEPNMGVTKVTALDEKPSSICYCPKNDTVAVTFNLSRNILLFKLVLRTYEKRYGNEIKPYPKRK